MFKLSRRAFTLIELLVVVSIIALLSALVLAALSTSRNKGSDAAIKGNLNTIRNQAELYYATTGNGKFYDDSLIGAGGVQQCYGWTPLPTVFAQTTVKKALVALNDTWGGDWDANHVMCALTFGNPSKYAVAVQSKQNASTWYCLDSRTSIVILQISDDIANHMYTIPGDYNSPSQCTP